MAYTPLKTDTAPESIRDFVRLYVATCNHDAHTMLRLPLTKEVPHGGRLQLRERVRILCRARWRVDCFLSTAWSGWRALH